MTSSSNSGEPRKIRVAVLFGGESEEHDVSLRSAQTVINALEGDQFETVPIGISREGRWMSQGDPMAQLTAQSPLFALNPGAESPVRDPVPDASSHQAGLPAHIAETIDVVFPVLHGPRGEDGTVQGLLELAGIPYVGSGVLGSSVAMDKAMAKTVLAQHGLRQAPWLLVNRRDWQHDPGSVAEKVADELGFPCFTKPANMGSSVGVRKIGDLSQLAPAMDEASRLDRRIVVEKGIDARELEISVLGNDDPIASCLGEVIPANEFYDYEAKYIDDRSELIIPANVPPEIESEAQGMAIRAFTALDLAGLARVDFLLDRTTGQLYLNEVNTLPGFTSISMYPLLWEASGLGISELAQQLVELAVERHAGLGAQGTAASRSGSAVVE